MLSCAAMDVAQISHESHGYTEGQQDPDVVLTIRSRVPRS
jgi:hypothetical protein